MEEFLFSESEWQNVKVACIALTNANLADDHAVAGSLFIELQEILKTLARRYGQHPILLETEADFESDPAMRVELYERARRLGAENGLPTLSIRLWLADVLIRKLKMLDRGRLELVACELELLLHGDERDRERWRELWSECQE